MSKVLTFMMGEFAAEFPIDFLYAKNHMWAQTHGALIRFGFTAYAVRLLQDVYFLEWNISVPSHVEARQEIGSIESKKAESSLYAPIAGEIVRLNDDLMSDPSAINVDKYGKGWLFEMHGGTENLLTPEQYLSHLEGAWELTQRTIKGQMNES